VREKKRGKEGKRGKGKEKHKLFRGGNAKGLSLLSKVPEKERGERGGKKGTGGGRTIYLLPTFPVKKSLEQTSEVTRKGGRGEEGRRGRVLFMLQTPIRGKKNTARKKREKRERPISTFP